MEHEDNNTTYRARSSSQPSLPLIATAAVVLAIGVGAGVAALRSSPVPAHATAAANRESSAPGQPSSSTVPTHADDCPASFRLGAGPRGGARAGQLVRPGARRALLCTYFSTAFTDPVPLATQSKPAADTAAVTGFLNDLSADAPPDQHPAQEATPVHYCAAANTETYKIVLTYDDAPNAIVSVYSSCGIVESGGSVRFVSSMKKLLAHW
ncbi:hypothetical protein HC031_20090 [Planosporangium thailandense]|uniref:DUF3558 domain-containing protein n=1 Tax=Planosporangium thailandense TaxID=765197 RepID=A0ABX0Y0W6_9ACTN|nr:hypothetical protein [Planosporangium thailandense]